MADQPEILDFEVDGATLGALRWHGLLGLPTVIAVHGITANARAWDAVAQCLTGAAEVVAPDLRGRGRSWQQPGPFGMRRHADDVAQIIEQIGGPLVLVGHSMGAYVVEMTAERHPALTRDLVLVDGGTALPRPADDQVDAALDAGLGPVMERLRTIWPDRQSYRSMWAQHPAFVDGITPELERNLLADLVEVDGGFRTAVNEDAVRHDGAELLTDEEVRTLLDRRQQPTTIVRAEFGMFGVPPAFIPEDLRDRHPQHRWVEGVGLNHYTVMNSPAGATTIADAIRDAVASP